MARNKYDIDERLETPFSFKHFKRAMVYVRRNAKKMIFAFSLSALSVIISLLTPLLTKDAVDTAIPQGNLNLLLLYALLMLIAIVVSVILGNIRQRIMTKVGQSMIYEIRRDLFKHLQYLPFQYYDDRPQGKILVRVVNYVNSVSDMLTNGIINFVLEIFNIVFIAVFMFFINVQLSIVIVTGLPLFIAVMIFVKDRQRRAWQNVSNKTSNQTAYLAESINCMRVTQCFAREKKNRSIFERLSFEFKTIWYKAIVCNNIVSFTVDNLQTLIYATIFFVGLLVLDPAMISLGTILSMSNYASRFWQPIINISSIYNSFVNTIAYLERIFETMDEPITVTDVPDAVDLKEIKGNLTFENVTFAYDEGVNILENLSFEIKAGESVALVGPTGAGKTTIVNLISRFYNLTGGRILIDGQDISKVTLNSLRKQMGIMLQDSFIFSGSIKENIRYGRLDATDDEIKRVSEVVCAAEFINEMDGKYDAELLERGAQLSQGQKQLLSFARTLLADPKILILDEATSSIDTKTEKLLQEGLQKLLEGRTSYIIAHRLSTIKNCDKIMFVNNKGVTECGTHDELIAKKGDYYQLYTAQG